MYEHNNNKIYIMYIYNIYKYNIYIYIYMYGQNIYHGSLYLHGLICCKYFE